MCVGFEILRSIPSTDVEFELLELGEFFEYGPWTGLYATSIDVDVDLCNFLFAGDWDREGLVTGMEAELGFEITIWVCFRANQPADLEERSTSQTVCPKSFIVGLFSSTNSSAT